LACGFEALAETALREQLERSPNIDAVRALGDTMLESGRGSELRELLSGLGELADEPEVRWIIARTHRAEDDDAACIEILETIKDAPAATLMLAEIYRSHRRYSDALGVLDELIGAVDSAGPWDWERMVCATLADRWDAVRDSAARIGMELPGEGPIDLDGPLCQVLVPAGDGREVPMFCVRNGPVTARVVQILGPNAERERFGDVLVFDADELNPPDHHHEHGPDCDHEDDDHVSIYRLIAELSSGGFRSFAIDGPHPGEAAIDALHHALSQNGVEFQVRSDGDYQIFDAERDDAELPGVYAVLAVPEDRDVGELAQLLDDLTSVWKLPIVWVDLAVAVGDTKLIGRHEMLEERFDL